MIFILIQDTVNEDTFLTRECCHGKMEKSCV